MGIMIVIFAAVFGTLIGSFLNVVISRLPNQEKLTGRSHCDGCGRTLTALDLIPVFSYAVLGGKCRTCGHHIGMRHTVVEVVTGALFALCAGFILPAAGIPAFATAVILVSLLVVCFVVDLEHFLILDLVTYPGLALLALSLLAAGIAGAGPWYAPLKFGIYGAFVSALPVWAVWAISKGKWMGFGDVKLCLVLGLALGPWLGLLSLWFGILAGGIFSIGLLATRKATMGSRVPFGTFLAVGGVVSLFVGQRVLDWYFALAGLR